MNTETAARDEHKRVLSRAESNSEVFDESPYHKNSMLYWYPIIDALPVNTPDTLFADIERLNIPTIIERAENDAEVDYLMQHPADWDTELIQNAAKSMGTPAFVRTDFSSDKERIDEGSRIDNTTPEHIDETIESLVNANAQKGGMDSRPFNCVAIREWVDIEGQFQTEKGAPIGSEVRFYVTDGDIRCRHFYWPEDSMKGKDADSWIDHRDKLEERTLVDADNELTDTVEMVADQFDDDWSIDFARDEQGEWWLIDMARLEDSWHPESCEHDESEE